MSKEDKDVDVISITIVCQSKLCLKSRKNGSVKYLKKGTDKKQQTSTIVCDEIG